ncbi:hypothetical protein SLE2022_063300 [Rubroshorea leprosula]
MSDKKTIHTTATKQEDTTTYTPNFSKHTNEPLFEKGTQSPISTIVANGAGAIATCGIDTGTSVTSSAASTACNVIHMISIGTPGSCRVIPCWGPASIARSCIICYRSRPDR